MELSRAQMLDTSTPIPITLPEDIVFEIMKFLSCYMRLVDRDQRERTRKDSLCFEPTSSTVVKRMMDIKGYRMHFYALGVLSVFFHSTWDHLVWFSRDVKDYLLKIPLQKITISLEPHPHPLGPTTQFIYEETRDAVCHVLDHADRVRFGFEGWLGKRLTRLTDFISSGVYPKVTTLEVPASIAGYIPADKLANSFPNVTRFIQCKPRHHMVSYDPIHWRKFPPGYLAAFPKLEALDICETIEDVLPSIKTVRFDGWNSEIELHAFPSATTYIASCSDLTPSVFENLLRLGLDNKHAKIVVCTDFGVDSTLFSAEEKSPIFNGKLEMHMQMDTVFLEMSMLEPTPPSLDPNDKIRFLQNMERFMKNNGIQHLVLRRGLEEAMALDFIKTYAKWCMEHKHPELTISIVCGCCNGPFTS